MEGSPAVRQLTLELARSKQSFYPTIRNGATRAKLCLEEVLKVKLVRFLLEQSCEPHKDETASGCILPFDGFTTLYQRNERKTSMLIFGLTNPQPQEMWPGDQVWKCLQNQNLNVFSIHLILSASSVCANRLHRSSGEKSGLCKGFASWLHFCTSASCGCSESTWNAWNAPDKGNNLIWIKTWKNTKWNAADKRDN